MWRYRHEVTHLWQRVLSTKYGEGKGVTKVCMGVVCGVVLVKGGRASLSIFLLLWVMVLKSISGMIDGLGLIPLKSSTLSSM